MASYTQTLDRTEQIEGRGEKIRGKERGDKRREGREGIIEEERTDEKRRGERCKNWSGEEKE